MAASASAAASEGYALDAVDRGFSAERVSSGWRLGKEVQSRWELIAPATAPAGAAADLAPGAADVDHTPGLEALRLGHEEWLGALDQQGLRHTASLIERTERRDPLFVAVKAGDTQRHVKAVGVLLDLHSAVGPEQVLQRGLADLPAAHPPYRSPFEAAAACGHAEMVMALARHGAAVAEVNEHTGYTAMHLAARGGHACVVTALLLTAKKTASPTDTAHILLQVHPRGA